MEWGAFDLKTRITIIPRGYVFKGLTPDGNTGKEYVVKYGVVGLDMPAIREGYLSDGMNEKRLALGMFYHPAFTEYPDYEQSGSSNTISAQDVANYVLSQFATVEEVKEGLTKVIVVGVAWRGLSWCAPVSEPTAL